MNLFFYQINKTSSLSISSHITHSSPDHLGQFSLTQSLLSQRAQTRHSTPDVSPSIQKRNITLLSPCWLCLCWYSPAGEASLQCHKDTLITHSQQILPCSQSPACPPAQLSHPRGRIRTSHCSPADPLDSWSCFPFHQPLPSQSAASTDLLGLHWSITAMKDSSLK